MKSAEDIANIIMKRLDSLFVGANGERDFYASVIKQAQIEALEWAYDQVMESALDDYYLDKVWDKIKELKGEK